MSTPPVDARRPSGSLGAIFLTVFLDLLGFGLVLPFLAEEARANFGVSPFVATLLAAVYSLMQFLFVPVWGRLSDRIGRRPVLLWSIAATAIGMAGLGLSLTFASHIAWLFLARIWSGIATANLGTASAYIADVTKPEDRARGMGLIGIAFGLGFILGPGVGGALADVAWLGHRGAIPCFVAAGLSVVNVVWVSFGLPESRPRNRSVPNDSGEPQQDQAPARSLVPLNVHAMREAFAIPGVARAVLVNFLTILAFTNLDQTFRFFNEDLFSMSRRATGYALAFVGVVAALVQGGVIRPASKKYEDASLLRVGLVLQLFAFAGLAASPSVGRSLLYAALALLAVGNGFTQPMVPAYISKRTDTQTQGNSLGTNQAAASLARTFGPAFGGLLYSTIGPRSPYVSAAIGMGVALYVALGLRGMPPVQSEGNTSTPIS